MEINDILHGERVRLTAMRPDDAAALARWWDDGAFMRLYDSVPAIPRTEAQIAKGIEDHQARDDAYQLAIRRIDDDTLLGQLEFDGISWPHRTTFFSIVILDPEQRGQGYGQEALELGLRFAFHELNLYRVALTVFAYNTRAITLYERLGFVHEGTHREFLERDGQRHDMLLYGLLRREWEDRRDVGTRD
ncbi:MAG TPA: GNAT family protein [Thermomicrobiales bacterium]|nr:GNAT family protein [Thermomicrobiales bacterium]